MRNIILVILLTLFISIANANYIKHEIFTDYDVTSAVYVYDEDGHTGPNSNAKLSDGAYRIMVYMNVDTINATSIDFTVVCIMNDLNYDYIFDYSFTTTGFKLIQIEESCYAVALGVKVDTATGSQNIDGYIYVERR